MPNLRKFLQQACCAVFNLPDFKPRDVGVAVEGSGDRNAAAEADTNEFVLNQPVSFGSTQYNASNPISEAMVANLAGPANALTFQDLANALFTPAQADQSGSLTDSSHAKVLAEIVRPLAAGFGPLLSAASGNTRNTNDLAAMRAEIDSLKTMVTSQQAALEALRQQPPKQD